jgi:hypothetical protein
MQRYEYMTWKVGDLGEAGAHVRIVDGEELARGERQPFYEALDRAGGDGWELVGAASNDTLMFKRPKAEA